MSPAFETRKPINRESPKLSIETLDTTIKVVGSGLRWRKVDEALTIDGQERIVLPSCVE